MIVGKLQLIDNIKREIPDNATGQVSPNDVRHNLLDVIDSVHLFTDDNYLDSLNFATPDTRSIKAGVDTLKNLHLAGYSSTDNVAVGYAALSHNYDGFSNTAVGSYAMSCNLYGDNNTALGYQALANNVFGSGNVAIGGNAIRSNKHGSYNIAIGHGAGYYIDTNSSYNFYLGSHSLVGESGVCENPSGTDLAPLLFGHLKDLKLGVGVNVLHGHGALQVAGAVSPSESGMYDLGHPAMRWQNIYLSDAIDYPNDRNLKIHTTAPDGGVYSVVDTVLFMTSGGKIGLGTDTPSGDYGLVTSKGSIVPHTDDTYSLGAPDLKWKAGYFGDITVSGTASITTFNYTEINSCIYECRTLYLASSGICTSGEPPCGWLQDQQIEGGGFVLQSSGTDYARNYEFTFTAPDATLTCLEVDSPYSRSAWNSNISIHIASGSHLKTDRVIGRDSVALINTNDCYGLFIQRDDDTIRAGQLGRDEIQTITVNATTGTFTLTYDGQTTSAIAFDASSSTVQAALEALSNIGVGDAVVTGNSGGPWTVTFAGSLENTNVAQITCNDVDLTLGGTAAETRTFFGMRYYSAGSRAGGWNPSCRGGWADHTIDNDCWYEYSAQRLTLSTYTPATQGRFRIQMRREDNQDRFYTDYINYDATQTEIADALTAAVEAEGITGVTFSSAPYHRGTTVPSQPHWARDNISEITGTDVVDGSSRHDYDPTKKPLSIQDSGFTLFMAIGRADREAAGSQSRWWENWRENPKISFKVEDYGVVEPDGTWTLNPDFTEIDGLFTFRVSDAPQYEQQANGAQDFVNWAGSRAYSGLGEEEIGVELWFTQPMAGEDDKIVEFYSSDTVAMGQAKFDAVFGEGNVVISSNGVGVAHHTIGKWQIGSAADDFAQAGWFFKYVGSALIAETKLPWIDYTTGAGHSYNDAPGHPRSKGRIWGRDGEYLDVHVNHTSKFGIALHSFEGQGATTIDGSCSTATVQDGSADVSEIIETDNVVYLAKEDHITPNPISPEGKIGNVTDVNFISSGVDKDYHVSYSHLNSGITVGQRLVTRTMRKESDNFGREKVVGFSIDNIDANDKYSYTGQREDRLTIAAYDDTVAPLNAITIMRSSAPGLVGVSNIKNAAHLILPESIFNIQSTGETIVRNTTWGTSEKTSLQLLGSNNNPSSNFAEGVELEYTVGKRRADMSLWEGGESKIVISLDNDSNYVGIHTISPNEMLTLGSGLGGSDPAISMHEREVSPIQSENYGKVYVKEKTATDQTQSLYFLDDGGNEFELVTNQYDVTGGIHIYTDASGNTFAGEETPSTRDAAGAGYLRHGNTAFGNRTIFDLESGKENTAFGYHAGGNTANGSGNVFLGYSAGDAIVGGSNNIVLGHQALQTASEDLSNSIIIGGKEIGRGLTTNYSLVIGADENNVLVNGLMGPTSEERYFSLPMGEFRVTSAAEADRLTIRHEQNFFGDDKIGGIIEKVDLINDQPQGGIAFTFKGADDVVETLFTLRHHADAMTTIPSYFVPDPIRPVAELKGDLNLLGSIRFADGTSLESTSGIITIPGTGLSSYINSTSSNEVFYLDIDGLDDASSISTPSATGTQVAVSTSSVVGKMTIGDLGAYISSGNARITVCENHILTNSSTIDVSTNCYNNIIGYRAGDGIANCDFTNFIGPEAGINGNSCDYSNFIGYRAGYGTANAAHSVFLGSSAGYEADNSQYAVFIGDSAGQFAASQRSIGIGDNALESVTGAYNIEITAGIGGSNRLIGTGAINSKIAIGTALGGDMDSKRMSIGQATINPSATLEVRAKSSDTTVRLQEWKKADGTVVAYLTQDGDLYIDGTVNSF
jgi:hypothetical protein